MVDDCWQVWLLEVSALALRPCPALPCPALLLVNLPCPIPYICLPHQLLPLLVTPLPPCDAPPSPSRLSWYICPAA